MPQGQTHGVEIPAAAQSRHRVTSRRRPGPPRRAGSAAGPARCTASTRPWATWIPRSASAVQLVRQLRPREQVARLRVAGDQEQRLLLPAPADDDGRVGPGQRLRGVERAPEPVVRAVVGAVVVRPHLQADLQRLLEALEALGRRWEEQPEPAGLRLVPRRADAEHRPGRRPGEGTAPPVRPRRPLQPQRRPQAHRRHVGPAGGVLPAGRRPRRARRGVHLTISHHSPQTGGPHNMTDLPAQATNSSPSRSLTVPRPSGSTFVRVRSAQPSPGIFANAPCGPTTMRPVRTS